MAVPTGAVLAKVACCSTAHRRHAPLPYCTVKVGHLEPLPGYTTRPAPSVRPGGLPDLSGGASRSLAPDRDDAANQDEYEEQNESNQVEN